MSIWIVELKYAVSRTSAEWRPTQKYYYNKRGAEEVLKAEWPDRPDYARVVEYVRKETE